MADIELVIKIPENIYKDIMAHNREMREGGKSAYYFEGLIQSGIPLPKGHGRLMILSEDKLKENLINLDFSCQKWISEVCLSDATVAIIEADKAESERI